jgi:hypothetical protein
LLYEGDIVVDDGVVVAYILWYVAYHAQVPVWFIKQLCCLLNISSILQHILTKIKKPINTSKETISPSYSEETMSPSYSKETMSSSNSKETISPSYSKETKET